MREFDYLPKLALFDLRRCKLVIFFHQSWKGSGGFRSRLLLRHLDRRGVRFLCGWLGLRHISSGLVGSVRIILLVLLGVVLKRQIERSEVLLLRFGAPGGRKMDQSISSDLSGIRVRTSSCRQHGECGQAASCGSGGGDAREAVTYDDYEEPSRPSFSWANVQISNAGRYRSFSRQNATATFFR